LVSAILLCTAAVTRSADTITRTEHVTLIALAAAKFPNLTQAERALLEFADIDNLDRGEWASGGTSADPLDASNDPKDADTWPHDRDLRASLIRWMCVAPEAIARVDPNGMRIVGARIVGALDLSRIRVPFAIALVRCSFPKVIRLTSAEIPELDLTGSYVDRIDAGDLDVKGNLFVGWNGQFFSSVHSHGEVYFDGAKVGGDAAFGSSHFQSSTQATRSGKRPGVALALQGTEIRGELYICCGFESKGEVRIDGAKVGGDLSCLGGARFSNPNGVGLNASGAVIDGSVLLASLAAGASTEVDGLVDFTSARVGNNFVVDHMTFSGTPSTRHGLAAAGLSVHDALVWQDVVLEHGAILDLSGASVSGLLDEEKSWPEPGKLLIDGFSYAGLPGNSSYNPAWSSPVDARSRLRWLGLQPEFHPQPYRQLAKVLRENGDDAGAIEVLVAQQDARFRNSNWRGRVWAGFLRITVGYGHKPLRTVMWSVAVILLGWLMVALGGRAGVMRATWPDTPPAAEAAKYEKLHPLLYSLDVFLPFVNLHQERYWWPDANAHGDCVVLNRRLKLSGAVLRYYLWMQVIAGWLLSAIFVAGVTGLMRND
jgi:hypothetical protein